MCIFDLRYTSYFPPKHPPGPTRTLGLNRSRQGRRAINTVLQRKLEPLQSKITADEITLAQAQSQSKHARDKMSFDVLIALRDFS